MNPNLFKREGHEAADGKGGVVYINIDAMHIELPDFRSYAKQISKIVKERFRNDLASNIWSYIYAYDGKHFYPIVNTNARSSAFVGKNAPYEDMLCNMVLCPPLSSGWQAIIPTENFGRVEFSCGEGDLDVSFQYPDSSYPLTSRQKYFPSLVYNFKRGSTKSYDFTIHFSTAFKIFVIGSLNRSILREDWRNKDVLRVLDRLYCAGSL